MRGAAVAMGIVCAGILAAACGSNSPSAAGQPPPPAASTSAAAPQQFSLPPAKDPGVDGFSGQRAWNQVKKQVDFGPRPPDTDAIRKLQAYLLSELHSYGCQVNTDDFHASTPDGNLAMKNIVAEIPGKSPNIILLATHYDTDTIDKQDQKMKDFVGADDAGSSTGVMLEIARVLCGKPQADTIWIAFFDGEEALQHWSETDGTYGSREMAAKLAMNGDLKRVKAMVLADLVGYKGLQLRRETNSTPWLIDIAWNEAQKLGYGSIFLPDQNPIDDDHFPFMHRGVPVLDIIDCCDAYVPYWHTEDDTLDKISPQSLQIVGDVILASLPEIEKRVH